MAEGCQTVHRFPYLTGIDGKGIDTSTIKQAALRRTRELGAQYNIFTDGSAKEGMADAGAGLVVTNGEIDNPTIVYTLLERGALQPKRRDCSFSANITGVLTAPPASRLSR